MNNQVLGKSAIKKEGTFFNIPNIMPLWNDQQLFLYYDYFNYEYDKYLMKKLFIRLFHEIK